VIEYFSLTISYYQLPNNHPIDKDLKHVEHVLHPRHTGFTDVKMDKLLVEKFFSIGQSAGNSIVR